MPVVIGVASIGPDQAVSNISKWIHWVGVTKSPPWLTMQSADVWAIVAAVVFSVVYTAAVWAISKRTHKARVANKPPADGRH